VEPLIQFLPLLAIVLLFWLLVIRPQQKRQKATAQLQASLQPGQRVMLTSGVFGTVTSLQDDRLRIAVADGVELEVVRAAVASVDEQAAVTDTDGTPEA
jgi:preprotein translocase subunit YajC